MFDRRAVLAGVSAVALTACGRSPAADAQPARDIDDAPGRIRPPVIEALDLSDIEAEFGGRIGVAAHSIRAERLVEWRADERFNYCSTFKMFLAAAVLARVEAGEEQLYREVPVTQADMLTNAPVTESAVGGMLSIERLCQGAVEVSDNPAANILIREIGGLDAMRAWYRSIGDSDTRVDRMEMELNVPDGDKDTIRPSQAVANLFRTVLPRGSSLSPEHRALLTGWMIASPSGPNRIKAGAPAGWTVAHKTGTASGGVNDIGLLTSGEDEVLIALYFDGDADAPVERGEAAIAEATRRALRALGHEAAA